MRLEQQYKLLKELKKEINSRLANMDFAGRKDLLIWLAGKEEYKRLKNKDNQLYFFDVFSAIWLQEIKRPNDFQMKGDAFFGISSLDEVERKYNAAKFLALRIEKNMPKDWIDIALDDVLKWQFSPYGLYKIISCETEEREQNIIKLSRAFMEKNQVIKAIGILEKENEDYPNNDVIILELANCWLEIQQLNQTYKYLCMIENKSEQIEQMIEELEKLINK